jgi:two-component system response regulator HydG
MEFKAETYILIVDDEQAVRELCTRVLTPLGFRVETAASGREALARFKDTRFQVVLSDCRMPGELDGMALGQVLKESFPKTRVVLMTGFPALETAVETLRMGAHDYLIKPFDREQLVNCVKACISKPQAA